MREIRDHLLQAQRGLGRIIESPTELIERLKSEGKSMGEIEYAVLELNRIKGAHDSVETALRILGL